MHAVACTRAGLAGRAGGHGDGPELVGFGTNLNFTCKSLFACVDGPLRSLYSNADLNGSFWFGSNYLGGTLSGSGRRLSLESVGQFKLQFYLCSFESLCF